MSQRHYRGKKTNPHQNTVHLRVKQSNGPYMSLLCNKERILPIWTKMSTSHHLTRQEQNKREQHEVRNPTSLAEVTGQPHMVQRA